ncbi:MAG: hypothetical protein AAGE01_03395 [Pseudomonadota bacterium]
MKKVKLSLHRPEQGRPEKSSRLAQVKRYLAWLESLPLGNMTAAGNQLLLALQEMNQAEIPQKQRLEMLDHTISPVLTVVGVLDRHYRDTAFPLDEKRDRVGRVAVQFFRELSMGYRLAAYDMVGTSTSVGFMQKRAVGRCLHAALACLEQMLYRQGMLYQQAAPQVWNEINVLYAFARQNDMHERVIESDLCLATSASIDDLFRRIALFGISDPSRLGQRAMRALAQAAALWARRIRVNAAVSLDKAAAGLFEIEVEGDDPPVLITDGEVPAKFDLVFDVRELRNWLLEVEETAQEQLRELSFKDNDGKPLIIDRDLINQLLATWGIRRKRSFQRLQGHHMVRLFVGLHAAHFMLADEGPFTRFLREYGDPSFVEAASRDRPRFGGQDTVEGRPPAYEAEVLNQSLGGYRLRLVDVERLQVRVGELVVLCADSLFERTPLWMMGIVRWLNAIDVREIELGIGVVGRDLVPAALLATQSGDAAVPHRALGYRPFRDGDGNGKDRFATAGMSAIAGPTAICVGDSRKSFCGPIATSEKLEKTSEVVLMGYARD